MTKRVLLVVAVLLAAGTLTPAALAARPHLGTPRVVAGFSGESDLRDAHSAPGHGDAYAVFHRIIGANLYTVAFSDDRGRVHRFDLPTDGGSFPEAVRLAALEDGGGIAVWDEGRTGRVLARAWTGDGDLGPTQTVLDGVDPVGEGDYEYAAWVLREDGRGTVVSPARGRHTKARSPPWPSLSVTRAGASPPSRPSCPGRPPERYSPTSRRSTRTGR